MANTKGITTLQSVVAEVLNDINEPSMYDWKRYMQWAIRGFKKLNMLYMNNIETYLGTVTDILTVNLPDDFIDYKRIGYVSGNEIYEISRNDDILIPFSESCGEEVMDSAMNTAQDVINYTWLAAPNKVFDVAFQRIDKANNRIILQGGIEAGSIMAVEYYSTGIRMSGETHIPEIAKESIIAFVHWQRRDFDGEAEVRVQRAKQRWAEETDSLVSMDSSMTPDEFLSIIQSGKSQVQ